MGAAAAIITLGHLASKRELPPLPVYPALGLATAGLFALSKVNGKTAVALGAIVVVGAALARVDGAKSLLEGAAEQIGRIGKSEAPEGERGIISEYESLVTSVGASAAATGAAVANSLPGAAPGPSGGWGGAEGPLKAVTDAAMAGTNVQITSEKEQRPSNPDSDHDVDNVTAYARDMSDGSNPTPGMDLVATRIVAMLGGPRDWGRTGGNYRATVNGLRWQVIYRSNVGGNHFNHVHCGCKVA
jgi:hypothetical protein